MNVFVSYRRDDSVVHARLIAAELGRRWGDDSVFMDIEDIPYGGDFVRAIDAQLARCEAVVAVIGPRWSQLLRERAGGDDYVRHELARAYALGKRVVPVLVGGAAPPAAGALPDGLTALASSNMLVLDERFLLAHVNALLEALQGETFEQVAARLQRRVRSARRMQLAGVAAALVMFFAAWTALFEYFGIDTRVATLTMWLGRLGAGAAPWSGQVVLAGIDEAAQNRLGRPFDAGWRSEHAQVIERAVRAGARAVAFDLFFAAPGDAAADARFESALRNARQQGVTVALGVEAMRSDGATPALLPRFAALATWGLACAGERYGAARSMVAAVEHGPQRLPSLALAAFSGGGAVEAVDAAGRRLRVRMPREERSVDVAFSLIESVRGEQPACPALARGDRVAVQWLDPAALPELAAPPRRLSYAELLAADDAALRTALGGRILLVGLQLPSRDEKTVASRPGGRLRFGVELIAAQLDAMLRASAIRPLGPGGDFLTLLAAGLAGAAGRRAAAAWTALRRRLLGAALALAFVALSALLYRWREVLLAVPYGLGAMALAWWSMRALEVGWPWRARRRETRIGSNT